MSNKLRKKVSDNDCYTNNVWSWHDFQMYMLGDKFKPIAVVQYIGQCIKWSGQRIFKG